MLDRTASSRRSVAFGIVFALVAMTLSFLAVLAASVTAQDAAAQQQYDRAAASNGCATTSNVRTFEDTQDQTTEPFRIMSDRFRLAVDTTGGGRLEVAVLNEQGRQTGERFVVNGDEGSKIIPLGPGTFRLELQESGLRRYRVTVQECRAAAAAASDSDTTQITAAAQTTAAQASPITAAEATTSNAAARAGTAGEVTNADAFRCELFLRVSRDGRGALLNQYRGDELIVQRIEQCFSEDVLRDTIPKRLLPDTGGPALLGLAALGLASIVAGASVLGAGLRRRR